MFKYQCSVCGGNCDAGELIGDICPECLEEERKADSVRDRVTVILNAPFEQMTLGELINGRN